MTVSELLARISNEEINEWFAFWKIEDQAKREAQMTPEEKLDLEARRMQGLEEE